MFLKFIHVNIQIDSFLLLSSISWIYDDIDFIDNICGASKFFLLILLVAFGCLYFLLFSFAVTEHVSFKCARISVGVKFLYY